MEAPRKCSDEVTNHLEGTISPKKRARISKKEPLKNVIADQPALIQSLLRLDPILQFLTKATGNPLVPLQMLQGALPGSSSQIQQIIDHIPELAEHGVLQLNGDVNTKAVAGNHVTIGFPLPPSMEQSPEVQQAFKTVGTLHGSTKTAAKRRLAALKRSLKHRPTMCVCLAGPVQDNEESLGAQHTADLNAPAKKPILQLLEEEYCSEEEDHNALLEEEKEARQALNFHFKFKAAKLKGTQKNSSARTLDHVLPKQASYAGSHSARTSSYASLSVEISRMLPTSLLDVFGLERLGLCGSISKGRKLYKHQATAIESAMMNRHTIVCTGTGSGKSLCFLIPVLAEAMTAGRTSILMFPTKALAQDQMSKLTEMLVAHPDLCEQIRPGILDGDVSHSDRSDVAKNCNIILTNPDTLHAAILPGWKGIYKKLLGQIKYIVIDEAHMYDGVFGAHVAMVISRLIRICAVCSGNIDIPTMPTFLACSATMSSPEQHLRLLCPIASFEQVTLVSPDDDGSPRASKHFLVWNPPILDSNGVSTGRVTNVQSKKLHDTVEAQSTHEPAHLPPVRFHEVEGVSLIDDNGAEYSSPTDVTTRQSDTGRHHNVMQLYRRHSADETALLLARAVACNVRCIAFCKTRNLVEWVYERTIQALKSDPTTVSLAGNVESYRGGYTAEARRKIEQRLFKGELTGVVGTSALELGVDIGGIELTLHCGYPSSFASLLQQAGRAGRGAAKLQVPSLAIMVCFNSPAEQHLWRHPKNFLSRGLALPISMPINVGLVRGHLLCAGAEYPLTGQFPVTKLFETNEESHSIIVPNDFELFGSRDNFESALNRLKLEGLMKEKEHQVASKGKSSIATFKTHPFVEKPWTKVALRSIETINYKIVDLSHPLQGARTDGIKDEKAVMDTIPYSRIFYHAFPGAVIMHRGRRYKVQSMTRPPAFAESCTGYRGGSNLAAYAKPTNARYTTRPLSTMKITVVKQMERLDDESTSVAVLTKVSDSQSFQPFAEGEDIKGSLGGNGVVTVSRSVHGFTKLSPVTRVEISRTELSMPTMEFDTFAFWLDTEATELSQVVNQYDDGVHALSHALLAVAPLFVPCTSSDVNCDHSHYECSRITIFDMRAGGAGTTAQLWKCLFQPSGLLEAAIDLLTTCPSCQQDQESNGYNGGCPACLQSGHCLKFNHHLSRSAALIIATRMLSRLQTTELYARNIEEKKSANDVIPLSPSRSKVTAESVTPRKAARDKAVCEAKDLKSARERQVVVGRSTWPLDNSDGIGGRQVHGH